MAKTLKDIRNQMKRLVEDINGNEVYYIGIGENTMNGEHDYMYLSKDSSIDLNNNTVRNSSFTYNLNEAKTFNDIKEAEKEAKILTDYLQQASMKSGGYYDYDIDIINRNGDSMETTFNIK